MEKESIDLLESFETWLLSEPTVRVGDEELDLAKNKTEPGKGEISGDEDEKMKSPSDGSQGTTVGTIVGGVVAVALLAVGVLGVGAVVVWQQHVRLVI